MFINKLANTVPVKPSFKGYDLKMSDDGRYLHDFNYAFDSDKYDCYLEVYGVEQDENMNYHLGPKLRYRPKNAPSQPDLKLDTANNKIDLKENYGIDEGDGFAYNYKLVEKNNPSNVSLRTDSAKTIENNGIRYNLVTTPQSTKVLIHGPMYLAIPDSFNVGYKYKGFNEEDTGKIVFEQPENSALRNFANKYNGTIAGLEQKIPELSKTGYKRLLSTPVLSGDNISSHHYWNKNNMQVCPDLGNVNNYASMQRALFRNGMNFVSDGVFTSEGLMGIHFQYAMKWMNKGNDPQTKDWFMLENAKNGQIGYGVIPENKKNLGHRLVNWPYNYEIVNNKLVKTVNPDYDNTQPKYVQIYDKSQVSDELLANKNELIKSYDKVNTDNELEYNTHNDTLIPFYFEFNETDYEKNLEELIECNKSNNGNIEINSPEGTEMLVKNEAFKIIPKFESGTTNWDANTDLVKMNYESPEVRDLTVSAGKYWTRKTKDILVEYAAHALGNIDSESADKKVNELINTSAKAESDDNAQYSILPEEVAFNSPDGAKKVLENVEEYSEKNFKDVLTESLMNLPLDSIEFADNVQAVLSTSFFTNRASCEEEIGKSRYELEQEGNPQLKNSDYVQNYNNVNSLFKNEIYDFAAAVLEKVDASSDEKIYKDGKLTTYGEQVIPLVAEDIAKYAIVKGLSQKQDVAKILSNNEIAYDYEFLNNKVSLDYLGVNGFTPKNEAEQLFKKLSKGVKSLDDNDIDFVAKSISGRLEGTNKNSFVLAQNLVRRSGLGLDWRLDAAKDVLDMDGIRDRSKNTEDEFNKLVKFWKTFTDGVKEYNPSSYIVAEITDIHELFDASKDWDDNYKNILGSNFENAEQAIEKFIRETGITSEANYSYLYTDLITVVSRNFESGELKKNERDRINAFNGRIEAFVNNAPEYVKNSYTFVGNHDKPRMLHCLAMDMGLFHSDFSADYDKKRAIAVTNGFNARQDFESLPSNVKSYYSDVNYFKNMSSKAVAMGYLLNSNISDSKLDRNSKEVLYKSIADIVNGNYAYDSENTSVLSTENVKNTISEALKKSDVLSEETCNKVIEEAQKLLSDKNFTDSTKLSGNLSSKQNSEVALMLLSGKMFADELNSSDSDMYSDKISSLNLETVSNSNMVRAAFSDVLNNLSGSIDELKDEASNKKVYSAIYSAVSGMLIENSEQVEVQASDNSVSKMYKKNGFGARPIDTALNMVFKHAEKQYGLKVENENEIKDEIINSIMAPALAKGKMLMNYLVALPGNPTMFAGDELAMTGSDEKCKNVYLQNRNKLDWTSLENNSQKQKFNKEMNEIMNLRADKRLRALNNGTPYKLNPQHTTTDNLPIPSLLMRASDGAMTVSLFNANGVSPENVGNYKPKEVWIDKIYIGPDNTGITLPDNIQFNNANKNDSAEYVTRSENGHYYIVRKDGHHINMNDVTAPNGVMLLYHDPEENNGNDEARKTSFRRNINKVYNIEKNIYEKTESAKLGENFSA